MSDDSLDEKKVVKAVAESQGLASVYSRRPEVARQRIPETFAGIIPAAKALAQDLINRCFELADERAARHRALFRSRLDLEMFHRAFSSSLPGIPVDFASDVDKLVVCCSDVAAARNCIPHLTFLPMRNVPPDLTLQQLTWDLDNLERAEAAYQAEANREYNFDEPAEEPVTKPDDVPTPEPQLVES